MTAKPSLLVRWLLDETVGVIPSSAVKKDQKVCLGAFIDAKFNKKFYEAEVLMISGEKL